MKKIVYIFLNEKDVLYEGDEFTSGRRKTWKKTKHVGCLAGEFPRMRYRRPIEIKQKVKKP